MAVKGRKIEKKELFNVHRLQNDNDVVRDTCSNIHNYFITSSTRDRFIYFWEPTDHSALVVYKQEQMNFAVVSIEKTRLKGTGNYNVRCNTTRSINNMHSSILCYCNF